MEEPEPPATPIGIATTQPTAIDPAFIALMIKAGADAVSGIKGGKEFLTNLRTQDLFAVAVVNARYDDEDYMLSLRFTNASGHGAYVEAIAVEAAQTREGPPLAPPQVVVGKDAAAIPIGERVHIGLPLYVEPMSHHTDLEIRLKATPGSWAARDAFGKLVVTIRPLNEEADTQKYATFAIRRKPTP